jgi:DMSO/TMAO reductase YedYZ molybdopterin-dependent catalytic subunit
MRRGRFWIGALLGALTSVPVIVLTYLGNVLANLPFVPLDLLDFLTRVVPRLMVVFGIDRLMTGQETTTPNLGALSDALQFLGAMALVILPGALLGGILASRGRRADPRRLPWWGALGGFILGVGVALAELYLGVTLVSTALSLSWVGLLFTLWGLALGWLIWRAVFFEPEAVDQPGRRRLLYTGGSAVLALVMSALGVGFLLRERRTRGDAPAALTPGSTDPVEGPAPSPSEEALEARIEPAPGTRPELTDNEDFYRIDINTQPPEIDADSWQLELFGLVDNPLTLTLDDIRSRPAVSQYITLSCISNQVGGGLISTSLWTGIQLKDLLEEAGLQSGAQELYIEGVDGFFESVSMADMRDERTLLVYAMNEEPLPVEHGFPLRIYLPNRYGMKQPKWIQRMEVIGEEGPGYWVERGWSEEAIVRTTSVIDNVAVEQADAQGEGVPIGGIAWAGARGISRVEVQVDDGDWMEAQLRVPPLSSLTWVQWRRAWSPTPGEHVARVRAYDGDGELQVLEEQGRRPDGATGVYSYEFEIPNTSS